MAIANPTGACPGRIGAQPSNWGIFNRHFWGVFIRHWHACGLLCRCVEWGDDALW